MNGSCWRSSGRHIRSLWRGKLEYLNDEAGKPVIDLDTHFFNIDLSVGNECDRIVKDCDAEVNNICSQMTAILKANGRDTAIVREVKKTYTDKKAELKQELIRQTYSGGDGSGSGIGCMIGWNENLYLQQFAFLVPKQHPQTAYRKHDVL